MVHIYYHIYIYKNADEIVKEQISLIQRYFDFPYILNIGICLSNKDYSAEKTLETIYSFNNLNVKIRDIRTMSDEWTTLDLIEKDKEKFSNDDYILYIHTKGASRQNDSKYDNIIKWRHLMNYFNIEKCRNVFKIFQKSDYNTCGALLGNAGKWKLYSGNFWWAKAFYLKSINIDGVKKTRYDAETNYIQLGKNWKPYSLYNREGENHYEINFKREEYAK